MRWRLPAYQLDHLVRADGASQLWRGRARSDNRPVLIRRLAGFASVLSAAEARADRVRQLGEPHLQVSQLLARGADLVVIDPVAEGGTLAELLTRRGQLSQGETVTVLAPVASALDAAHRAGVIHGSISSADIVLTAAGRPSLTGLVVAAGRLDAGSLDHLRPGLERSSGAAGSTTDLRALAAVAFECLTGTRPVPRGLSGQVGPEASTALSAVAPHLARVVIAALSGWSGSPEQFAAELVGSQQPEPVRLRAPAAAAEWNGRARAEAREPRAEPTVTEDRRRPAPRHRNPDPPDPGLRQRLGIAAVLLALVAVFGWAGVRWAASDESAAGSPATTLSAVPTPGESGATPTAAPSDGAAPPGRLATIADVYDPGEWKTYLSGLYRLRAGALMDADVAALDQVFSPNSTAYAQAAGQISALVATQTSISNFRPTVIAVSQVLISNNEARVTVLDNVPAYTVRSKSGSSTKPGRGQAKVLLILRPSDGRWLIAAATIQT